MKHINKLLPILSLMLCCLLPACSNNDEPSYSGKDNFITEFSLKSQGGEVYSATIQGSNVMLSIPSRALEQNLTVSYKLSTDATISPDPISIKEWRKSQEFVVTSKQGEKRKYTVTITSTPTQQSGDVRLNTDEEVTAFAAKEINIIEGDLIIGDPKSDDIISTLESLSFIQRIKGSLVITKAYEGESIELPGLIELGSLMVEGTPVNLQEINLQNLIYLRQQFTISSDNIRSIRLPKLDQLGDLTVTARQLEVLDLSQATMAGNVVIKAPFLKELSFNKMTQLTNFTMVGVERKYLPEVEKSVLPLIEMPELTSVLGLFKVEKYPKVTAVKLPKLKSIIDMVLLELPMMETIQCDQLKVIYGKFNYKGYSPFDAAFENTVLKKLSFPSLEYVHGEFNFNLLKGVEVLDLPKVKEIDLLDIYESVKEANLPSLEKIKSRLNIRFWSEGLLANLKEVKEINLQHIDYSGKIDLSHMDISKVTVSESKGLTGIITPKVLDSYSLSYDYYFDEKVDVVSLEGLEKCGEINYNNVNFETAIILPSTLKEVTKVLGINGKNLTSISAEGLEVVGTLAPNSKKLFFHALKKVTERLDLTNDNVTDFEFPQLTEVKRLEIGGSSWKRNSTITNLNGLANLETIGSLSIKFCESLVDYSGLKKAFDSGSITPSKWTENNIQGNAYNPTYQELKSGQWVMP